MGKLDGKVAVITAATSGMALASAKLFVQEGAYVFITGRRKDKLDEAVKAIGRNVTGVQGDAANLDDLDRLYDTVDLHWLREARRSEIASPNALGRAGNGSSPPASLPPKAVALRELELAMMRATDATMVVSEVEREQVLRDVPGANVLVVPTVHEVEPLVVPVEERRGILFLGGFEHMPNVDAAARLVEDVMPLVWSELGDVEVTIVGSSPPPEVRALASTRVDVAGWVEDLDPLIGGARLMVAPLRFGAGVKGKVTQCLAMGLPVVTSSVGAEGLDVADGESILVADEPSEIAARIVDCYRDDELWRRISVAGQAVIDRTCSPRAIEAQMRLLLGESAAAEDAPAAEADLSLR